jgi:hypothetical protein
MRQGGAGVSIPLQLDWIALQLAACCSGVLARKQYQALNKPAKKASDLECGGLTPLSLSWFLTAEILKRRQAAALLK